MPDMPGTGPYPAIREVSPTLADHVVYRPRDLAAMGGKKLGVLVWGNGGCRDDGAAARMHLMEIASYGYLVVAPGGNFSGPGATPRAKGADGRPIVTKTTHAQVLAGLDWALAENRRKDSPLFGRIDEKAIAASGHSCGGIQALAASTDPRIATTIIHNSGIFNDLRAVNGVALEKSHLQKLHAPILYVMGGPTDIAYDNGTDDYRRIKHIPAVLVDINVGHGGTFRSLLGGRAAQIDIDWLEWRLRGDAVAGRSFTGPVCRLCTQVDLRVQKNMIDPQ
ncbi:hypothetical protein GTZ99_02095 [Novosphingobium sp. FSY-8]|uniref:Chlorophyllase-like protein n=2 Tax=Novosphingobium ovatum TaxID=1908523 RepID=A0ABW9X9Y6_9SPHN|nr:hypothetical protein [Novosphingobium ovatum]